MKIVDGLFTSKIRYGVWSPIVCKGQDQWFGSNKWFIIEIQKIQNKLLRMLTNTKLQDTVTLLQATKMLSVNQINPQIKILEIWKSLNIENYPIKLEKHSERRAGTSTRPCTSCKRIKHWKNNISQKTCMNDAVRLWNQLPVEVTHCETFSQIKMQAKRYAQTLPLWIHYYSSNQSF